MIRRVLFGVLVLSVAPGALAGQGAPPVLTLQQAVQEALARNDRVIDQHDAVEQADLGLRLAQNEFRPKVIPNVLGSFGQTNVSSQTYRVDVTQKFATGTAIGVGVGTSTSVIPGAPGVVGSDIRFYNADTTVTISQPLLRGFGAGVARRPLTLAEVRTGEVSRQRQLTDQRVALDVAVAYYRVVAQQAVVDVARQSLDRSRKLRDASEAKLGAGLVSQLDVLRAQQLVAQAEIQLFDSQAAVEDATDQLKFLMHRDPADAIVVQPSIPRPDETPIDLAAAVTTAYERRVEMKSALSASADADRQLSFTKNQLLPQVDVNFALTRRQTADTFLNSFGVTSFQPATFFTISMPVDRTPQLIAFQNAAIDRDRRRRDVTTLQRQIADGVKRGVRERDRLARALAAAETSVSLAQQEVDIAQLRYERGLSNNLDVVTAETSLLAAESRRIQALADSAIASLNLRAILGTLDPRQDIR